MSTGKTIETRIERLPNGEVGGWCVRLVVDGEVTRRGRTLTECAAYAVASEFADHAHRAEAARLLGLALATMAESHA